MADHVEGIESCLLADEALVPSRTSFFPSLLDDQQGEIVGRKRIPGQTNTNNRKQRALNLTRF